MPEFTQDNRPLRVGTVLGKDVLLLERFSGEEGISLPFRFTLEMLSLNGAIDPAKLLRTAATVTLELPSKKTRTIHGLISRFSQHGERDEFTVYHAEIVPWLWFLSLSADCRIFQNLTALQIVEKVFKDLGYTDFQIKTVGSPPPKRDYCVQYRETHLNFASRLLADEGYFYFFEHSTNGHKLIVANHGSAVVACPNGASARMAPSTGALIKDDVIHKLHTEHSVISGAVVLTDYNFENPAVVNASVKGKQKGEIHDYPGGFTVKADADRYARIRLEEREALQHVVRGEGSVAALQSGYHFKLEEHSRKDANQVYQLLRIEHEGNNDSYITAGESPARYINRFVATPHSIPFRPPHAAMKPVVRGSQTAVVVGPSGEEIYTDKHGRVKVQFHWDREGKKDANSSCWVRVSSTWAGKNWGFIAIPRIGQEVVVDFLEGDPDRPLITGAVYNGEQTPPYGLPDNQTQSGVKSRSSKSGDTKTFNELRFEDKKGSEEVYLHAEKDHKTVVENNEVREVGLSKKDPGSQTITVHGDQTLTINDGHQKETVKKGNQTVEISQGDQTLTVKQGKQTVTIQGNQAVEIKQGNQTVAIKMGNHTLTLDMGNSTTKAKLGKITHDAMQSIELKVGQSSIKVDQMGVTIKGMMVKIEGQIQTQIKGMMTQVNGDAMLMAKGGITMIN